MNLCSPYVTALLCFSSIINKLRNFVTQVLYVGLTEAALVRRLCSVRNFLEISSNISVEHISISSYDDDSFAITLIAKQEKVPNMMFHLFCNGHLFCKRQIILVIMTRHFFFSHIVELLIKIRFKVHK